MIGAARSELGVDLGDLGLELVDQKQARVDVASPGLGQIELGEQPAAGDPEEIGDRAGAPEADQRRVDPVLELRSVLHQVEAKASELALSAHFGSGSQIAGTRSRWERTARTRASIRSVFTASGASPLTFWASAISTSQP